MGMADGPHGDGDGDGGMAIGDGDGFRLGNKLY